MNTVNKPTAGAELAKAKLVEKWFNFYINLFGLSDWDITLKYAPVEGWYSMTAETEWHYKKAEITVDLSSDKVHEETIPAYTRHELFHLILSPLADTAALLVNGAGQKVLSTMEEHINNHIENMPLWSKLKGPK